MTTASTAPTDDIPLGDGQAHIVLAQAGDIVHAVCGLTFRAEHFGPDVFLKEDRQVCTKCFLEVIEVV